MSAFVNPFLPLTTGNTLSRCSFVPPGSAFLKTARSARGNQTTRIACTPQMLAFSSIQGVLTEDPVALPQDVGNAIAAVYRQVLGNAYLMDSEREELDVAESQFVISRDVKEFVRALGKSDAYRTRFFEPVSQYRFIELVYKHFLGRAPRSKEEYGEVMGVYHSMGYEAVIDYLVDSDEYEEMFGTQTVPYGCYKGCYPTNEEFNRSVVMRGRFAESDKAKSTMLQYAVPAGNSPNWLKIAGALPIGTERGTGFTVGGHWTSTQRNTRAPVRKGTKIPGGVVFY